MTDWQEFDFRNERLRTGDSVRMSSYGKLAHREGTFLRAMRKNYAVMIDGKEWRVTPTLIAEFRRGNGELPPEAAPKTDKMVDTSDQRFHAEVSEGDIVLMYRGKFDIVKVLDITGKNCRCRVLDGRGQGKVYRYKTSMYVQKLDGDRIITE